MERKGKKRCVLMLLLAVLLFVFSGCGISGPAREETSPAAQNSKSEGYENFCQLEIGMTQSQVNAILGQPAKVDKSYSYYTITVNGQKLELSVWFDPDDGQVIYLGGSFSDSLYRGEFADSQTDLSAASGLETDELSTYDDCAAAFMTPGFLTGIDISGVKSYLWVDDSDGYIQVTFRADGTVKAYAGFF